MNTSQKQTIKQLCRHLRKQQTESEKILWDILRNRKLSGLKFLRQHPIIFEYYGKERFFIADFYCHDKKLVIEVDGKIHESQKEYDQNRTHIINSLGIKVIRIRNEELQDINGVRSKILRKMADNQ